MGLESLDPVVNRSLREVAASALRRSILNGALKPGERLVETAIAEQIGVSRAPVREALRQLEMEGLVVSEPHRGTFVVELSCADLWEIYTLRAAVEGLAAQLVTRRADAEMLSQFQKVLGEMEQAAREDDRSRLAALDMSFHETLCRAAGHSRLLDVWLSMTDQIRTLIDLTNELYLPPEEVVSLHSEVVDHIENGRARRAGEALTRHILDVGKRICEEQTEGTDTPHT
ncbi:MAG: GntR family transcriptional regulator [Anaerolineae bacterium]